MEKRFWRATGVTLRHRAAATAGACLLAASALSTATVLGATSAGASPSGRRATAASDTMTVLEGAGYAGDWNSGLDPGVKTGVGVANATLLDAVYGQLFDLGAHNRLVPDLATGYRLTGGARVLTISLRHGVRFSDGTPFDASAVAFNFRRDLSVPVNASVLSWPKVTSITTDGSSTVTVRFATPDGAAVTQMLDNSVSWIASPTALQKLGEQRFKFFPVGAGPFKVVSDTPAVKLVLQKNPNYWQPGHPYLKGLTFQTVSSDESALEDLQSHNAQAYEYMTTPQLVSGFTSAGLTVTADPGPEAIDVQLNAGVAPFNNLTARKALYYATNSSAIDQKLFGGSCPLTQSFTGPGGLFYEPKVPGYPAYDPAKARALVRQLHGLSFTLWYFPGSPQGGQNEAVALQTMYDAVGMHVKLGSAANIIALVDEYDTHKWQAVASSSIGSYDPAGGIGVAFRLASTGPFTGIASPTVDHYITEGAQSVGTAARAAAYAGLAHYLGQQAYTPFICAPETWDIAAKGVSGPGLTTATGGFGEGPLVRWQDVSFHPPA